MAALSMKLGTLFALAVDDRGAFGQIPHLVSEDIRPQPAVIVLVQALVGSWYIERVAKQRLYCRDPMKICEAVLPPDQYCDLLGHFAS